MILRKLNQLPECSAEELAAYYRLCGLDKYKAWDMYIIHTGLKPQINSKEFYKIFSDATPAPIPTVDEEIDFHATHIDTIGLYPMPCMITRRDDGVYEIIWENGSYGTNPAVFPPSPERFMEVE